MRMLWAGVFSFSVVSIVQLAVGEWKTSLALFGVVLYLFAIAMKLRGKGYATEYSLWIGGDDGVTPLELNEDVQDQTEAEFSLVKVREEKTRETIYELENGQVVTHRKGLFEDDPDSFKVS